MYLLMNVQRLAYEMTAEVNQSEWPEFKQLAV